MELIKQPEQLNPAQLLTLAVDKDIDIEKLRQLMQMKKEWDTDQARKAFFESLAKFQSEVPELRKNKSVAFKDVRYNYAPLSDITRQIKDTCRNCNLSYRWEINDTKEEIKVTCLVTHVDGHTERTTMTASPDDSGSKNKIQARGSSIEYLKRYTLIGALGLSTSDSDIDGRSLEYEYDVDKLHKTFMETYNQLITLDPTMNKFHPDNWLIERTGKNYVKAIGDIRKKLFDLQKHG